MKTINCLRDLEQFGIVPLTGEADSLSYRILCDLTKAGVELIAEAYGFNFPGGKITPFANAWNSGREDQPHIASIMLSHDAWRQIAPIALVRRCRIVFSCHAAMGYKADNVNPDKREKVYEHDATCIIGIESDETFERADYSYNEQTGNVDCVKPAQINDMNWPSCYGQIGRYYAYGSDPREGSRNVHAMSGRTV